MPAQPISSHHRASPRGAASACLPIPLNAALLAGLLLPAPDAAALDCAARLAEVRLPAGASEILRDETLRINNRAFCYIAYRTELAPEAIIERQRGIWRDAGGMIFEPPRPSPQSPQRLLYRTETQSRHLEAVVDGDATAVSVSIMAAQPATAAQAAPSLELPPALEPMYRQRNRHGSTTVIDTAVAAATAQQRLIEHLTNRGWTLQASARAEDGLRTLSMQRRDERIEIGVMPDGERTGMIVNFIKPGDGS